MSCDFIPRNNRHQQCSGFALLETIFAMGMIGVFLSILMVMSSNLLGLLRTAKDNVAATQTLQERVEQMRIANWVQITDANYIATQMMNSAAASTGTLDTTIESVTVSAYPAKTGFATAKVTRQNQQTQVVSSNSALKNERMVRVDIELGWQGFPKKRMRSRAATVLIAKGGITK